MLVFVCANGRERIGENVLDDLRGDDFAGTAPGREGVEDDDLVILDGGLEFGLAVCLSVSIHKKESRAGEGKRTLRDCGHPC